MISDKVYLIPQKAVAEMRMPEEAKELVWALLRLKYGEHIASVEYRNNLYDMSYNTKHYHELILEMEAPVFWTEDMNNQCANNKWEVRLVKEKCKVILVLWVT